RQDEQNRSGIRRLSDATAGCCLAQVRGRKAAARGQHVLHAGFRRDARWRRIADARGQGLLEGRQPRQDQGRGIAVPDEVHRGEAEPRRIRVRGVLMMTKQDIYELAAMAVLAAVAVALITLFAWSKG